MKTYVLGFIALGLTNLMIAQNNIVASVNVSNHAVYSKSKAVINMEYLNTASHNDISNKIKKIQKVVANYDIKKADVYQSKNNSTYDVTFKEGDNIVVAVYNNDGTLISCKENYQSIKLPYAVSSKITRDYPGWAFKNVECNILYSKDETTSIAYQIVIKQGNKTKRIKITV